MAYTEIKMDLHLFEGGAAGASAAPAAGAGEGGEAAVVSPGTLNDGTQVDARLAARMEEQARKRRARGEAPVQAAQPAQEAPEAQPQAEPQAEEPSLDDQWAEAKKKFKDQYGRDVKAAVDDRFKNQKDASQQLAKLTPALKDVTAGLSTAFETTLVALAVALALQLLNTFVRKSEEEMLDACTEFCTQNIVMKLRLTDRRGAEGDAEGEA